MIYDKWVPLATLIYSFRKQMRGLGHLGCPGENMVEMSCFLANQHWNEWAKQQHCHSSCIWVDPHITYACILHRDDWGYRTHVVHHPVVCSRSTITGRWFVEFKQWTFAWKHSLGTLAGHLSSAWCYKGCHEIPARALSRFETFFAVHSNHHFLQAFLSLSTPVLLPQCWVAYQNFDSGPTRSFSITIDVSVDWAMGL